MFSYNLQNKTLIFIKEYKLDTKNRIYEQIRKLLHEATGADLQIIGWDTNLKKDLKIEDSHFIYVSVKLETDPQLQLNVVDMEKCTTVRELVNLILEKIKRAEILKGVKEILIEQLGVDINEVTEEANIAVDLGADSLDIPEIICEIENKFDILIEDEDVETRLIVGTLVSFIQEKLIEKERTKKSQQKGV